MDILKEDPTYIFLIVIAIIAIIAVGVSLIAQAPAPEWKNAKLSFDVGGITDAGDVDLKNTSSVYTPKLIKCAGLHIMRDYDSDVTYTVFFFDEDDKFVSSVTIEGRQYNVDRDAMPVSEDGRQAVGFRVAVAYKDSTEAFSKYDAWKLQGKFDVEIAPLAAE